MEKFITDRGNQESYIKDLSIELIESQRQGEHGVVLRKTVKQCARYRSQ